MANGDGIRTRDVREGLRRLIESLEKVDKAELKALESRVSKKHKAKTSEAWIETLRDAERELKEWCPNPGDGPDQFTIDVNPRRR